MRYQFKAGRSLSRIILQDYFAITMKWENDSIEPEHHLGYYYKDTGLLELGTDWQSTQVKKLVLTMCKDYHISTESISLPMEYEEAVVYLDGMNHIDVDMLVVNVYSDGISLKLKDCEIDEVILYGNAYFHFSNQKELVKIDVFGMTEKEVEHAVFELENA